jgi:hypothetical protein
LVEDFDQDLMQVWSRPGRDHKILGKELGPCGAKALLGSRVLLVPKEEYYSPCNSSFFV